MKRTCFYLLILTVIFLSKAIRAEENKELPDVYPITSAYTLTPDNDQHHFKDLYFVLGWNKTAPYQIGIQFINQSYDTYKLKFAIKDMTSKKMVILDKIHNTAFGIETLPSIAQGAIWSGAVDAVKDKFMIRMWDEAGDEFDSKPMSIKDKKATSK